MLPTLLSKFAHRQLCNRRRNQAQRTMQRRMLIEGLENRHMMATFTWDGGGADGNWTTGANWVGDVAPAAGDDLVFTGNVRTTNSNNYTAGMGFNSITFDASAGNFTISGNQITLNGGTDIDVVAGTQSLSTPLALSASSTTSISGGSLTISSVISGSNDLSKTGSGTLTLSGANTFSGGLTIKAGVVAGSTSTASFGTGTITIGDSTGSDDATLRRTSTGTITNAISVASGNSGIATIASTVASTFSGAIALNSHNLRMNPTGSGILTVSGGITGTGDLQLITGSTGGITVSGSSLNHSGTITNAGTGSGDTTISAAIGSNVTSIILNSTTSALTVSGAITVNSTATTVQKDSNTTVLTVSGGVTGTGDLVLRNNTATTDGIVLVTGSVNNTGTVTNAGTGTGSGIGSGVGNVRVRSVIGTNVTKVIQDAQNSEFTLAASNTYSSGSIVKAGVFGASALNGATTNLFGTGPITIGSSFASTSATLRSAIPTTAQSNAISIDSSYTGTAELSFVSSSGASGTFSGPISLNGRDLSLTTVVSGNLNVTGGITGTGNVILKSAGSNTITLSGSDINNSGTITNSSTGTDTQIITAAVGSNVIGIIQDSTTSPLTVSGALSVNDSETILANAVGGSLLTISGGTTGTGNLTLRNNSATAPGITLSGSTINHTGTLTNSGTGSGSVGIAAVVGTNVTGIIQDSSDSRLVLSGANTFTSGVTIKSGMLRINHASALGSGTVTLGNTSGSEDTELRRAVGGPFANPIVVESGNSGSATITNEATTGTTFSGAISLNNHGLIIKPLSSGSITVSGAITGTGTLTTSAESTGTIAISGTSVNHVGAIVNEGSGTGDTTISATIGSNVTSVVQNSAGSLLTLSGAVSVNSAGTTFSNNSGAAGVTVTGAVSGTGDLLLQNNSSTADGVWFLGSTINNTGLIVNSGTGSANAGLGSDIGTNVTGVIQNSPTSRLGLAGSNTFTTGVTIKAGLVRANHGSGLGTGPVTLGDTTGSENVELRRSVAGTMSNPVIVASGNTGIATLSSEITTSSVNFSGAVTLNNHDLVISQTSTGDLTLSGGISGTGNLAINAASTGEITFSGSSLNHTGSITNSGVGSGAITVSAVVGTNVTGVVQNSSTSSLTLSGANTFSSGLAIQAGTITGTTSTASFGTGTITLGHSSGSNNVTLNRGSTGIITNPIVVAAGNSGIATISTSSGSNFSGGITLDSHGVRLAPTSSGNLTISGGITGTGNVDFRGTSIGGIVVSGTSLNSTGAISNISTGSGDVTISAAIGSDVTSITQNSGSSSLTVSGSIAVNGSGTTLTKLAGASVLTVSGGTTGIGNLVLNNNSTTTAGINLTTTSINHTGSITNSGSGTGSVVVGAVIGTNVTGVVQNSITSTLTLSGVNTYTSGTMIYAGTATLNGSGTFGASSSPLTVNGSSAVANLNALTRTVGAVSLRNDGTISNGTLTGSSYSLESGTVSAILAGSGIALTKSTSGTVTFSGVNTYTGGNTISAGTLALSGSGTLGSKSGSLIVDGSTAIFDLGTSSQTVDSVSLKNGATITNGTLTGTSYAVESGTVSAVLAGTGNLAKSTSGTVTLSGANTFTGTTTVSAGSLLVNGSLADGSSTPDVAVSSGAILGGTGTINGSVSSSDSVAPGVSIGVFTVGTMSLSSGSELAIQLGGLTPGSGSSNHDQLKTTGTSSGALTIGSGVSLDLSMANGFVPQDGDIFTIVDNTSSTASVSGTFNGLPEGGTISTSAGVFQISYVGGTGNDVVLTALGPVATIGNASAVTEGSSASFTVTLSAISDDDVTVYYSTGTGTAGSSDFTSATSSIVILAGQLTGNISVTTTDDTLDEAAESFTVTITSVTNGIAGSAVQGTGTINDNDPTPTVTIANATAVTEGTSASFTVTLSAVSGQNVIVNYATAAGTAGSTDFTSATSSITINAGQLTGTITVATNDDGVNEVSETFTVTLTGATNASLGTTVVGTGTIDDNDPTPTITVSASASSFSEKTATGTTITFTRSGNTSEPLIVNYSYGGTGASPARNFYGPRPGTSSSVEIPAGSATATITLRPIDDAGEDGDQDYTIELDDTSDYDLGGTSSADFTVTDEDDDYYALWCAPSPNMPTTPGNVKQPCGCEDPDPATGSLMTRVGRGLATLINYTAANPHPIIAQDVTFTSTALTADVIHVTLTLGSLSPVDVYYDPASIVADESLRIAVELDASLLGTGRYDWTMTVTEDYASSPDVTQTFYGHQDIRNLIDTASGNRWSPAAVAHLEVGSSGALLTEGYGGMSWFHFLAGPGGGDYIRETGESGFSTIAPEGSGHKVTAADKSYRLFDSDGLLISSVDDRGRETTYTYIDGDGDTEADEIETITDPLGRTTTFAYSSGKLSSTTDFAGRTTSYTIDTSGRLLDVMYPDPDGAGPLTSAVVEYTYDSTTNLLTSVTNGEGETTSYTYNNDRTLATTTYPDGSVEIMDAVLRAGLVIAGATVGSSGTPASFVETVDVSGSRTDTAGSVTTYQIDNLGYTTEETDDLGNTTQYIRNADGQVVAMFQPDPDGAGPMEELRTFYHYDTLGNLVFRTNSDGTTESWSYNSTWNKLENYVDPLGRVTTYDLDSGTGDVLVIRRIVGLNDASSSETDDIVTTFTYTPAPSGPSDPPAGLVATMWDALGVITNYEYNAHGLLTKITYATSTALETFVEFEYDTADNLTASIDELGRRTEYDYDNLGRMTSMTLPDPDKTGPLTAPVYTYEYDKADRLIKSYDPLNRLTEFVYNSGGQLEEVITPDHDGDTNRTVTTYVYDTAGRLDEIIDALGFSHISVFDELSRATEMHEPSPDGIVSGPVYKTSYGALGWTLSTTDPLDNVTNYIYENFGKKVTTKLVNPATGEELSGPSSIVEYDAVGNLIRSTDALGRVTTYEYDSLDRLVTITQPDPTDDSVNNPPVTTYTYDKLGRVETVTDPLSNVTTYTYDERGRLTQVRQPNITTGAATGGPETDYEYDDAGQLVSVTNALEDETTFTYDDLGRLLTKVLPDPDGTGPLGTLTTTYAYDAVGNLTKVTDARGNFTVYEYDDHNNLIEITQPDPDDTGSLTSPVWAFTYDDLGNKLTAVDPMGHTTTYEYDDLNRLTRTTSPDPDGAGSQLAPRVDYTYDLAGNLLTVTDRLGHGSTYAYDHLHRRTSVTNANSELTAFTYDAIGNLLSLTDPEDNTTSWTYDALNRTVSETNELNATRTFAYDNAGNLISKVDRLGRGTEYTYDHLHRQTAELWKDGSGTIRTLSYSYDALGQLLNVADPSAEYDYEYDAIGRVTLVTTDLADLSSLVELTSVFDEVGNRLSLAATIGSTDDFLNSYTYDDLDRLTRIQQEAQSGGNAVSDKRIDLSYNALGQWDTITRYQSQDTSKLVASSSFAYDLANRLTSIDHTRSTTDLAGYDYTYDAANRITSIDSFLDGLSEYTYDNTSQLTDADHTSQTDEAYEYDDNGNRVMTGHDVDPDNRLVSDGTYNYAYDAEGNRISRTEIATGEKLEYTWDQRNRLTLVTYKDNTNTITKNVAYEYDVFDRRVRKRVDDTGNGTWDRGERYVYDGPHATLVFDDSGDLIRRNLYGDAIDQIIASEFVATANETNWYFADHLGTVRDVYSYDDVLSDIISEGHIEYDSFGNIVAGGGAAEKAESSYIGREWDADAQLYYYRKRWYDAATGQFVSKDPIGLGPDSNARRYVGNMPTMLTDPSGLAPPGSQWWNNSGWDYWNPSAYGAWAGDGLGTIAAGIWYYDATIAPTLQAQTLNRVADNTSGGQELGAQRTLDAPSLAIVNGLAQGDIIFLSSGGSFVRPSGGSTPSSTSTTSRPGRPGQGSPATTNNVPTHANGHGHTLRDINKVGGTKNCASTAIATDATLGGSPASALNTPNVRSVFPQDFTRMVNRQWYGANAGQNVTGRVLTQGQVADLVATPGQRGIVYGFRADGSAHYFNVVNQNGVVRFLDGQTGTAQVMDFIGYMFMPTN